MKIIRLLIFHNKPHSAAAAAARAQEKANQTGASATGESANLAQTTLESSAGCGSIQEAAAGLAVEGSYGSADET